MNKTIKEIQERVDGITIRRINGRKNIFYVLFIGQLTDKERISREIVMPLSLVQRRINIEDLEGVLFSDSLHIYMETDVEKIIDYVLKAQCVVLIEGKKGFGVIDITLIMQRAVQAPEVEGSIKSPKDAFTENIETNISLLRYRIKNENLKIDKIILGEYTKTAAMVVYLDNMVNQEYLKKIKEMLDTIDTSSVLESGYLQKYLSSKKGIFPQVGVTEKSDSAAASILEGKICIVVEGSNFVLLTPYSIVDFLDSSDDHYEQLAGAVFAKFIRYFSVWITLFVPGIYLAFASFHTEMIPARFIVAIAASRVGIPLSLLMELIIMSLAVEILREASTRIPNQIGNAISIVGAIVIGQ